MSIKKSLLVCFLYFSWCTSQAQFQIGFNPNTGAVNRIALPADEYHMNWIFSSSGEMYKWQKPEQDWGMGKYRLVNENSTEERWTTPSQTKVNGQAISLTYPTRFLHVLVERKPAGDFYVETYTFKNITNKKLNIASLDIYTPFNDSYPDAQISATNRCNAHIWPGMHSSYVNAVRMNGQGKQLGLVLTKGAMQQYSIENRSRSNESSNTRGTIVLNTEPVTLQPGASYTVQWQLFWHNGWNDFFKIAKQLGFVKMETDKYVISKNEKLKIDIDAMQSAGIKKNNLIVPGITPGEYSKKIYYDQGRKQTLLKYFVISSPANIINKRVQFIVNNQQMNDSNDLRYGAYLVFDNELKKMVTDASASVSPYDRNEGAERLGMGVLVAKWLRENKDEKVYASLLRYVRFVRTRLQTTDYQVFSDARQTSRHRGYNYPWVARLYLEMYFLTNNKVYLEDYYKTMRKFFGSFSHQFYGIDIRVVDGLSALSKAGMQLQKDTLLNDFRLMGNYFVQNGINYPKHEVNYEQSIVAPSITFLCELYLVTKDQQYLNAAKLQMPSLEAFNGRQPDVHLNDIAIRHWDGYWFGKEELFGDTMPHYWSTLTAIAFQRYFLCTGDLAYKKRAIGIVQNNLLNFKENGEASCAYIYPAFVNDKPGQYYDSYANDQDWALVFYEEIMEN